MANLSRETIYVLIREFDHNPTYTEVVEAFRSKTFADSVCKKLNDARKADASGMFFEGWEVITTSLQW